MHMCGALDMQGPRPHEATRAYPAGGTEHPVACGRHIGGWQDNLIQATPTATPTANAQE